MTRLFVARTFILLALGAAQLPAANAGVLPEERTDLLYHRYSGDEVTVSGPSLLVRKQTSTNTSVFFNYYIDNISSASIDVRTSGASRYIEERTEQTLGVDYLHGKTTMGFAYTDSAENDYEATSYHFNLSQDFFGDLTTLSMGYSRGSDTIRQTGNPTYLQFADKQSYRLGLSQIITRNFTMGVGYETITDEGSLRNPYRVYSYCNPESTCAARGFAAEIYPNTRTSNALSVRGSYFLPYRAALHGEYKIFNDSWDISATTMSLGYTQPISDFIIDLRYRLYSQTKAEFYSDLFNRVNEFNFLGRDKELSTFDSVSFGTTISYEIAKSGWWIFEKGSLNLSWDHIEFTYKDFRDVPAGRLLGSAPGTEPLFAFGADVIQLFVSLWY